MLPLHSCTELVCAHEKDAIQVFVFIVVMESVDQHMTLLSAAVKQAVMKSFSRQPSCGQLSKMQSHYQIWQSSPYAAKVKQRRSVARTSSPFVLSRV